MQRTARTALPEGVPAEGLKVLRTDNEEELEREFARLANDGYVPAQPVAINAEYDDGAWQVLYVLVLWKVGHGDPGAEREMYI